MKRSEQAGHFGHPAIAEDRLQFLAEHGQRRSLSMSSVRPMRARRRCPMTPPGAATGAIAHRGHEDATKIPALADFLEPLREQA
jgi:hypothetical protein